MYKTYEKLKHTHTYNFIQTKDNVIELHRIIWKPE